MRSISANWLSCSIFSYMFCVANTHFIREFYNTTKLACIYTLKLLMFYVLEKNKPMDLHTCNYRNITNPVQ